MSRKTELTEQHWHKGKSALLPDIGNATRNAKIDYQDCEKVLRYIANEYRAQGNMILASQFKHWAQSLR